MNRVESTIKEHEGLHYLDVTSYSDDGAVVYTHQAWVDSDPALHAVLLDHAWTLNARTGHLTTHTVKEPFRAALLAQGPIPAIVALSRCLAACVAAATPGGRKLDRVFSSPTDLRVKSLTITWEATDVPTFTPELVEAESRTLMVSPVQSREVSLARAEHAEQQRVLLLQRRELADQRRKESDERRELAEQRAQARHFKNLGKETARKLAKDEKVAGQISADACKTEAKVQLEAATGRGEIWAIAATRAAAGHAPAKGDEFAIAPEWYQRLTKGLPVLLSEADAFDKSPQRYERSQAAFEEFCKTIPMRLSRRALRAAWVKKYPVHDWVAWVDSAENKHIPVQMDVAALIEQDQQRLKLPAPALAPDSATDDTKVAAQRAHQKYLDAKRREEERGRAIAAEEAQERLLAHAQTLNIEAPKEDSHAG